MYSIANLTQGVTWPEQPILLPFPDLKPAEYQQEHKDTISPQAVRTTIETVLWIESIYLIIKRHTAALIRIDDELGKLLK